jgi:hypothetical protein
MGEQLRIVTRMKAIISFTKKLQDERDRKNTISITKAKKQNLHTPGSKLPGT